MKTECSRFDSEMEPEELRVSTGTLSMVSRLLFPGSLLTSYQAHRSELSARSEKRSDYKVLKKTE
ncbi:hypothetical protein JWG44_19670 [Leptospira sp. 201903071]|uniref:hypothetical protein n=1 Tax=Leptospira ainazelensis TaxID=2810034 RepID=UPI0019637083|nr:hypothetical protein [Leptospira ainazelensis]MBM9502476.1 hypothetical protein [Leptospira ainazelensis]